MATGRDRRRRSGDEGRRGRQLCARSAAIGIFDRRDRNIHFDRRTARRYVEGVPASTAESKELRCSNPGCRPRPAGLPGAPRSATDQCSRSTSCARGIRARRSVGRTPARHHRSIAPAVLREAFAARRHRFGQGAARSSRAAYALARRSSFRRRFRTKPDGPLGFRADHTGAKSRFTCADIVALLCEQSQAASDASVGAVVVYRLEILRLDDEGLEPRIRVEARRHAAHQILDEARIVVSALGDELLVGPLQDAEQLRRRLLLGEREAARR